jgi:hypothetical protein
MGIFLAFTLSSVIFHLFFFFSAEFMPFNVRWSFGCLPFWLTPVVWGKKMPIATPLGDCTAEDVC